MVSLLASLGANKSHSIKPTHNIFFSPPLSRYNASFDLYYIVYNESSEVTFSVAAIDNGVPRRGTVASVRLTLSNTCLLSALFEEIYLHLEVDGTTGQVWFRIPKYWVYDFGRRRMETF